MVFGNRGPSSGTGVLFTRNPATGEDAPYGDFMFEAQGEDVVAGTHATAQLAALEERLPEVAAELRDVAQTLERHFADLCDIEYTIEDGRLWLLQVRVGKRSPRAALRMAIEMADDPDFPLTRAEAVARVAGLLADQPRFFVRAADAPPALAAGLPASPGVASGVVVTSSEAAESAAAAGQSVILVRPETSPEDVRGMSHSAGVLTARGGLASHAAVVARGWGIPAVVGAGEVVGTLAAGERISIDGSTGEIFRGELAGEWQVAPEAATLLTWAGELGIAVGEATSGAAAAAERVAVESNLNITAGDVLRALAIKGVVSGEQLAEALGSSVEHVGPLVDALVADGTAESTAGQVKLTAEGKLRAGDLFAADRGRIGEPRSAELLEEFHAFDGRMKQIVTDWQVRDVAGEQALNDHTDAAYDGQVLDRLAELDADTSAWLGALTADLPHVAVYRARLVHALDLARGGDQRFVASPRVDSYHSVWFELHEHLIRLAGKKRSEATSG